MSSTMVALETSVSTDLISNVLHALVKAKPGSSYITLIGQENSKVSIIINFELL